MSRPATGRRHAPRGAAATAQRWALDRFREQAGLTATPESHPEIWQRCLTWARAAIGLADNPARGPEITIARDYLCRLRDELASSRSDPDAGRHETAKERDARHQREHRRRTGTVKWSRRPVVDRTGARGAP